MKFQDAMPPKESNHLVATDLSQPVNVVIREWVREEFKDKGEPVQKPVLYFVNAKKGLVLNITNGTRIINICGDEEMNNWIGREIQIYPDEVLYDKKMTPCLRVRAVPGAEQQPQAMQPAPPAVVPDDLVGRQIGGEDLPF